LNVILQNQLMKIIKLAAALIVTTFVFALLVLGKSLLIPFFLAIVIWYLINAIYEQLARLPFGEKIPKGVGLGLAATVILGFLFLVGELLTQNINTMISAVPTYKVNIEQLLEKALSTFGISELPDFKTLSEEFNLSDGFSPLLNGIRSMAQNSFLILVYVVFLLLEQKFFASKISELRLSNDRKDHLQVIFTKINDAAGSYIAIKTLASFITAGLSYLVLIGVGVDFALFWAFLIFLLNYIPTVGSIIATAFPALLTLVQFDGFTPFLIVLLGVLGIQVAIGSFLEPRLLGDTLNISPLVVILSLALWGLLWGVVGMLLCVPITIIMIIIFAQFPTTRPIAVFLSKNGEVGT